MNDLYRLINVCWQFGKKIFEIKPTTIDEYRLIDRTRSGLYDTEEDVAAKKFIRSVTLAVIDYYEDVIKRK